MFMMFTVYVSSVTKKLMFRVLEQSFVSKQLKVEIFIIITLSSVLQNMSLDALVLAYNVRAID